MPESVEGSNELKTAAFSGGFSFKKLFSDVAVYSAGNMLIKGLSLISAPIFTRIFDPVQYGAWGLINVTVAFLTGIILLGGDNAYTRFFFQCKDEQEKRDLSFTWFAFLAIWSAAVIIAVLPFSGTLAGWIMGAENYRAAFVIGLVSAPPAMLNIMLSQALRNRFQARIYTIMNIATAVLTIGLAVFFVLFFRLGVAGALLGNLAASLIMIPVRLWVVRDLLKGKFNAPIAKKLLSFGLPLVPMNIAFWLFSNADRIMLARMGSLADVGIYTITASMVAVIMLLQNAVGQSWLPHGVKIYEEDSEAAEAVFKRTMLYFLACSGFIITAFVALAQEVLFVLVPPAYYGAFKAIPYLAAGFIFFTSAHISVVAIMVRNKTVYIMIVCWIVAGINIALNFLLIPPFGITGAGAATGISYILYAGGYALISHKLWPLGYSWFNLGKLLIIPLIATGLIAMTAQYGPGIAANLAIKLLILILCGLALALVVSREEGKDLMEMFITLQNRLRGI